MAISDSGFLQIPHWLPAAVDPPGVTAGVSVGSEPRCLRENTREPPSEPDLTVSRHPALRSCWLPLFPGVTQTALSRYQTASAYLRLGQFESPRTGTLPPIRVRRSIRLSTRYATLSARSLNALYAGLPAVALLRANLTVVSDITAGCCLTTLTPELAEPLLLCRVGHSLNEPPSIWVP